MSTGLEENLAVRAGRAEEPLLRICKVVNEFVDSGQDSSLHAWRALRLFHSLVPAVSRGPCPISRSCPCVSASPGS